MKDAQILLKAWREKYPGAYDQVDDAKLLAAIKEKYPGAYDEYGAEEQPTKTNKSDTNTIGQGVYDVTIGPVKDILEHQKSNVNQYGPFWATFKTGFDLAKGLIKGSNDQAVQALKGLAQGNIGEFIQHAPGVIPGIGPAAVGASEQMEQGNIKRGIGQAVGLIGTSVLPEVPSVVRGLGKTTRNVLSKASDRMIESALKPEPSRYSPAERADMVSTIQTEGLPISYAGQKKLYQALEDINQERKGIVSGAPKPSVEFTPKNQPQRLTAGPREMPPIPPPPGTEQAIVSEPAFETTLTSETSPVPRGLLTPGRAPKGSGRYVADVEAGRRKPLPIVTRPVIGEGITADKVIYEANRNRGFTIQDKQPEIRGQYVGPYNPPTTSTRVVSKEAAIGESARPGEVATRLEHAKNQQLIDVINERAEKTGLLRAAQDAARASGKPVPSQISDIFDVKLKNVIYPKDVARRIDQIKERYQSVNPEADLSALEAAKQEFLRNYPHPLSLQRAQKLKATTYSVIGKRPYMEKAGKPAGATAGEQALAHGLMEELAAQIPEVKAVNARETKLFGVREAFDNAVGRIRNWELFSPGLYGGVAALTTGVATHSIEATAAVTAMMTILRNPNVKSRLAIAMSRAASRQGKTLPVSAAKALLESYAQKLAVVNTSLAGATRQMKPNEQSP